MDSIDREPLAHLHATKAAQCDDCSILENREHDIAELTTEILALKDENANLRERLLDFEEKLGERKKEESKQKTHTRACPKCGKIVPWTFGEPQGKYKAKPASLICLEHGEFTPFEQSIILFPQRRRASK